MIETSQWRACIGQFGARSHHVVSVSQSLYHWDRVSTDAHLSPVCVLVIAVALLMSGDIESNPGPNGKKDNAPSNPHVADQPHPQPSPEATEFLSEEFLDPLSDPVTLLDFLENVATRIPAKWRKLGIALNITSGALDGMDQRYHGDQERCYEAIFEALRNQPEPLNWRRILKALRTEVVNEAHLADELSYRIDDAPTIPQFARAYVRTGTDDTDDDQPPPLPASAPTDLDPIALSDPVTLLDFLESVATRIPTKWRRLGLALNIPSGSLDGFQERFYGDQVRCYEAIYEAWLNQSGPPNWIYILKALQTKLVNEEHLAAELSYRLGLDTSEPILDDAPTIPHIADRSPRQPSPENLGIEQFGEVMVELSQFFDWKNLGLNLGLYPSQIIIIEDEYSGPDERLQQVLLHWLQGKYNKDKYGSPTWSCLADALKKIDPALADLIQNKNCTHDEREDTSGGKEDVKAYEAALKEGKVTVKYGRVLLLGPARVGKTSLRRGLMNQSFRKNERTTPVASVDTARPVTYSWAKYGETYWESVTEDESEELGQLMAMVKPHEKLADIAMSVSAAEMFSLPDLHSVQKSEAEQRDVTIQQSEPMQQSEPKKVKQKKKAWARLVHDVVEKAKAKAKSIKEPKVESDILLYLWDSGGQHVFLEVLPIFLTSRTMFLFIFNASEWFFTNAEVIQKQEKRADVNNVLTLELMEQWMAMIYCQLAIKDTKNPDITAGYPQIYPIGTHGDKLDESAKKTLKADIQSYYHEKDYNDILHREPLIVDNTKAGKGKDEDPGYKTIREAVSRMVTDNLQVPTPVAWVLFRVVVGKLNRTILLYEEACEIAYECRISMNDCSSVLNFYHELGVFLFYSHIKGLQDKVIVDPKWLVDQLGKLLKLERHSYDTRNKLWRRFEKEGRVQKALYETVWKGCGIEPSALMNLLVSFHLASPVPHSQEEHKEEFFVPCVLDYYKELPSPVPNCQEAAAPLYIFFKPLKFVPPGFFTRLVTRLAINSDYKIDFDLAVHRRCVTYSLKSHEKDKVTLTELPSAFKVEVKRTDRTRLKSFYSICQELLTALQFCCEEVLRCYRSQTIFTKHEPAAEITWKFAVPCLSSDCPSYCFFVPKKDSSLTCEKASHYQQDHSQLHWLSKVDKQATSTSSGAARGDAKLTIDDLVEVEDALPHFIEWNKLGLKLGLSPTLLEEIEEDHHRASKRLQEVLKQWLRKKYRNPDKCGEPTWNWLASAVEDIDRTLAETIRKDHC